MGVVFDEIVGQVEPETRPAEPEEQRSESAPPGQELSPKTLRYYLYRLARRKARLKAD